MGNALKDQIGLRQQDSHAYTASYDAEWTMGPMLLGGCVAAVLYSTAHAHFTTTLASQKQPDVQTLHIEFFRPCTPEPSAIKVTDLKIGKGSCFIQLDLSQNGEPRCTALATSTDFTVPFGPTAKANVPFLPALPPGPDLKKVEAYEPDENWLPSKTIGELLPFLKRMTFLYPVNGQPTPGIIDYWCAFDRPERFDGAHLAMLCDMAPSTSDTLLRTEGVFDAHKIYRIKKETAEKTPGKPAILRNSLKEAAKARIWNTTLTMDLQFKRRLPEQEMMWTFTRVITKMLDGGRMDLDFTICDEELVPICLARQIMLVIDARRRFKKVDKGEASKL
ncbi:thioesterase family protein [Lindgomyces ingoldianus]|uniref:Thioesterase family protein n=1 Tax=Lindgomyces ingoldianus TaxID=673940 RepID=A0ACB6QQ09_9PLEO|nr:thioesterase family protein [Lindgomyces ingoldianus]KAF2469068.1 thioesterase family protein [Lindgomyces ingoldianus]